MPPWPSYDEEEIAAAGEVLASGRVNYWTGGEGRAFEEEFAAYHHLPYAIALSNGTVALEVAIEALRLGPGDDVIVPPRTFVATISSVARSGARPVFADVEPIGGNLTAETIAAALTPETRAIVVVHLGGWPADMPAIAALAEERGLEIIEDCAQAHGAKVAGRLVGTFGSVGCFSMCQDKIITTAGEGGMVVTSRPDLWDAMWSLKDHGKNHDLVYAEHPPGFRWLHTGFGTNGRLTESQAAIGRIQLRRLATMVATRRRNAAILDAAVELQPALRMAAPAEGVEPSYYKYYTHVRRDRLASGWDRDRIMAAINAEGVPCFVGSCSEVYLEAAFAEELRPPRRLPVARQLGETSLMFLVHPTLTEGDMGDAAAAVAKVMAHATG
jgi:hypothetical protein